MGACEVRRAVVADAAAVHALRRRAIRESAAGLYPPDALERWADGGSEADVRRQIETTAGFVAASGDRVVGWANLDGDEVGQLYVDPDHGGKGTARRLYEAIEALAVARQIRTLTATASLRSIPVFGRFGFTAVLTEDRIYDGLPYRVADMVKAL